MADLCLVLVLVLVHVLVFVLHPMSRLRLSHSILASFNIICLIILFYFFFFSSFHSVFYFAHYRVLV